MRRHTGEKPYICEFCDLKFGDKSNLNSHRKRRHGCTLPQSKVRPRLPVEEPIPNLATDVKHMQRDTANAVSEAVGEAVGEAVSETVKPVNDYLNKIGAVDLKSNYNAVIDAAQTAALDAAQITVEQKIEDLSRHLAAKQLDNSSEIQVQVDTLSAKKIENKLVDRNIIDENNIAGLSNHMTLPEDQLGIPNLQHQTSLGFNLETSSINSSRYTTQSDPLSQNLNINVNNLTNNQTSLASLLQIKNNMNGSNMVGNNTESNNINNLNNILLTPNNLATVPCNIVTTTTALQNALNNNLLHNNLNDDTNLQSISGQVTPVPGHNNSGNSLQEINHNNNQANINLQEQLKQQSTNKVNDHMFRIPYSISKNLNQIKRFGDSNRSFHRVSQDEVIMSANGKLTTIKGLQQLGEVVD